MNKVTNYIHCTLTKKHKLKQNSWVGSIKLHTSLSHHTEHVYIFIKLLFFSSFGLSLLSSSSEYFILITELTGGLEKCLSLLIEPMVSQCGVVNNDFIGLYIYITQLHPGWVGGGIMIRLSSIKLCRCSKFVSVELYSTTFVVNCVCQSLN